MIQVSTSVCSSMGITVNVRFVHHFFFLLLLLNVQSHWIGIVCLLSWLYHNMKNIIIKIKKTENSKIKETVCLWKIHWWSCCCYCCCCFYKTLNQISFAIFIRIKLVNAIVQTANNQMPTNKTNQQKKNIFFHIFFLLFYHSPSSSSSYM